MALMDFLSSHIDCWRVSARDALFAQDNIVEDAFVDVSRNEKPSGDTFIADTMGKATSEKSSVQNSSHIYDIDNSYMADAYEDLSDPMFTVSSDCDLSEDTPCETVKVQSEAVAEHKESFVAAKKESAFANFSLGESVAFGGKGVSAQKTSEPLAFRPSSISVTPAKVQPAVKVQSAVASAKPQQTTAKVQPAVAKAQGSVYTTMSGADESNQIKSTVGFNTNTTQSQATGFSTNKFTTGARTYSSDKAYVQILTPTKVQDVGEACAFLKEGAIVMAVLSGITDKGTRMRYLDFLSGCCKGCDAEFKEIVSVESSDCVLVATPHGISIKLPPVPGAPEAEMQSETKTTASDIYGARGKSNFGPDFTLNFASDFLRK